MLKILFGFLSLTFLFLPEKSVSQNFKEVSWQQLAGLRFEEAYNEATGGFYEKPIFGPVVQMLEGEKIKISGYVIPMDVELNVYVVSQFPFSSCFFCGGAGPESVIELNLRDSKKTFKNDERASFCGILKLNTGLYASLPYSLENCEVCD